MDGEYYGGLAGSCGLQGGAKAIEGQLNAASLAAMGNSVGGGTLNENTTTSVYPSYKMFLISHNLIFPHNRKSSPLQFICPS